MSSRRPAGPPPAAASPRECVAQWLDFTREFDEAASDDQRRDLARRLPDTPAPAPEAHPPQADLLRRAWPLRPAGPLPPWRHLPLPGPSRLAWARLAVLVEPSTACRELLENEPALWATALAGLDPLDAVDPPALLAALLEADDPASDRLLRHALPRAVARGLLAPPDAASRLLRRDDAWGWATLGSPWAAALPLPRAALRRALRGPHALAALPALAARLPWSELRPLLLDPPAATWPDGRAPVDPREDARPLRRAAAAWAGRVGDGGAIDDLLAAGLDDPAGLGDDALAALAALHRRGHFVQPAHAGRVLALLAAGARAPGVDLAGTLFVARRAVVERLPGDADDPLWLAAAPLLAAWLRAPRPPAGLLDALVALARRARRPAALACALGLLRGLALGLDDLDPAPLEDVALARLDDDPPAALALLAVVAGEPARAALSRRLAVDPAPGPARVADEALAPLLDEALAVLWFATPAADRPALLATLDPRRLPGAVRDALPAGALDEVSREARLLGGDRSPVEALCALCALATPDDLPRLEAGLLRSIEQAIAAASPRHPGPPRRGCGCPACAPGADARSGEDAERLPDTVSDALDALEARWRRRHRRPAWLLAPGPRLRAELLVRAAAAAPARADVLGALLRSLLDLDHPRLPALAAHLLDHPDPGVARLAARLLARRGPCWLSLALARGAAHPDDRLARACLEALGEVDSPLTEATALAALERPTMNLKKAAAAALGRVASPASAPALLAWLGRHDNPGLREGLTAALRRALGDGYLPAVLAALSAAPARAGSPPAPGDPGDPGRDRRRRLLVEALDGEASLPLVRALLRQAPGWERHLLEAIASGSVRLRDGRADDLAPELAAAGLAAPGPDQRPPPVDPLDLAVDRLARLGWSPDRADAVLAAWPAALARSHVERLRTYLDRWLDLLADRGDPRPAALALAVLEASPGPAELAWLRAAAPALGARLLASAPADRASLWPALERLAGVLDPLARLDLGEALRAVLGATPGLARSPLGALRRCGLVLRRHDVERALAGVADVPDPLALRRAILAEAFGVAGAPAGPDGPRDAEEALRALIHEAPRGPTDALLWLLDRMEALRPIGVPSWLDPAAPPGPPAGRPSSPDAAPAAAFAPGDPAALAAWLRGEPGAGAPDAGVVAALLPSDVVALATDAPSTRRLLEALVRPSTPPAVLRAYRPWIATLVDRRDLPAHLCHQALRRPDAPSPWQSPAGRAARRDRWLALWTREVPGPAFSLLASSGADRGALSALALGPDPEAARRALTRLSSPPDAAWPALIEAASRHASPRVRLHALRLARRTLPRPDSARLARPFLLDDDPSTRRAAVRIVAHSGDPSAPALLAARLLDRVAWVRSEALSGLRLQGPAGLAAVRRAIARARPDEARRLSAAARSLDAPDEG